MTLIQINPTKFPPSAARAGGAQAGCMHGAAPPLLVTTVATTTATAAALPKGKSVLYPLASRSGTTTAAATAGTD